MKRTPYVFTILLLYIGCLIFMTSCSSQGKKQKSDNSDKIKSSSVDTPIDELIEEEKVIFESLLVNINDFFNPSEVRILEIGDYSEINSAEAFPDGYKDCYIKISGTNRAGGTITQVFRLVLMDYRLIYDDETTYFKKGDLIEGTSEIHSKYESVDIGRINKALKYYWDEKMGY